MDGLARLALFVAMASAPRVAVAQAVVPIPAVPEPTAATQQPALEPPADLTPFEGRTISRVAVALEGNVWDDVEVPPVRSVKIGEPFTAAAARRALDEALRTGRFARGRVSASISETGGVLVLVRLVPRKIAGRLDVDLHGASLDRDELLREADLSEGGEIVATDIDAAKAAIERNFARHGFPSARADVQTRPTDDPMRVLVVVDVTPGAPRHIDDRHFYVFGAKPEDVKTATDAYLLSPGDRADQAAMNAADAALEQSLHARGWYRADVSHDLVSTSAPGRPGRVALRVRVDAGPLFVPRFDGNDHYDAEALGGALGLDTDPDRSPAHLADKIRAFYQKRGFLDADVRAITRGAEADPVRVLAFHVEEGARVRVVARRYPCLKVDAVGKLSSGGPRSPAEIGTEIDSFLEEELPGADLLVDPDPKGLDALVGPASGQIATGNVAEPIDLDPDATYVADTYERATTHVQELYRNEGFLHAQVGPVQVIRARCDPKSPPGTCAVMPLARQADACTYDAMGLPLPPEPIDASLSCRPDAARGVECAHAIQLIVPVKLGPRTTLWDAAFTGVRSVSEQDLAGAAQLPLGEPVSTKALDDARRRIVDWYRESGYAYADVKYALEPSLDNTRARVRFEVSEGNQVTVRAVVVRGLGKTRESVVRRRIALQVGQPFRASDVRKTQERIATLGVFSSVTVSLEDPYVPGASKVVVIDVIERMPHYIDLLGGFSTGEGIRGGFQYDERNIGGYAIGLTFRTVLSYLPNFLILDPQVAANYEPLGIGDRMATRNTVTVALPEVGLGPTVRSQLDGVYVRALERDFTLFKAAFSPATILWRPARQVQLAVNPWGYEHNDVHLFESGATIADYLNSPRAAGKPDLKRLLRVPDGDSYAFSERVVLTWDRRDNAFNAHRGTYVATGVEHVDSYPISATANPTQQFEGHFLRLTQTIAAYLPITSKVSFAAELRLGEIVNVSQCARPFDSDVATPPPSYCTYPDRLFFMGGFDSMRGWLQDSFMPQEYADQIAAGVLTCTDSTNCQVPLRGGNLMVNPRFELRFPLRAPVDAALFSDLGNLWNDPSYVFEHRLTLRADAGAGIRVVTPVGPLVFDYGVNLTRRSYEDFGAFHFAIGLF